MPAKSMMAALCVVICAGALSSRAAASPPKPIIVSAAIDKAAGIIILRGFDFPRNPKVYMGKDGETVERLQVRAFSPNMIEATLKATSPGRYLVTILGKGMDPSAPESFDPQSLPANSPVFRDAMIYMVRME